MTELPTLSYEVTPQCNLNCEYCYNHWKPDKHKLSQAVAYRQNIKTLKRIVKQARVKHISFTGGEPFMADRFAELVLFARLKGISVSVISNGVYATIEKYRELEQLGVSVFELPCHSSDPAIHDSLTHCPGSCEKSIAVMRNLVASNARVVAVIVLTKKNCAGIDKTIRFIKSLGINQVMVNRINLGGNARKQDGSLIMSHEELKEAYKTLSELAFELDISVSSNVCTPICILNPTDYKGVRFTSCSSDFSKRPVTLDYDGNIRFCNHSPVILGNIFSEKPDSILNSKAASLWENTIPDFCNNCKVYEKCRGGCRAASEQLGYSLSQPDPILAHIAPDKLLLKELNPDQKTAPYQ